MENANYEHPVFGLLLTISLFISSVVMGALENADLILNIISKLVAIGAGVASIGLAYLNYRKLHNGKSKSK